MEIVLDHKSQTFYVDLISSNSESLLLPNWENQNGNQLYSSKKNNYPEIPIL